MEEKQPRWWTLNWRYLLYLTRECTSIALLLYAVLAGIALVFPFSAWSVLRWVFLLPALLHTITWLWTGWIVLRGIA